MEKGLPAFDKNSGGTCYTISRLVSAITPDYRLKNARGRKTMPPGLELAPEALPDHSWQCTEACSGPQCQVTPEDGTRIPRLLTILLREAVEFAIELRGKDEIERQRLKDLPVAKEKACT